MISGGGRGKEIGLHDPYDNQSDGVGAGRDGRPEQPRQVELAHAPDFAVGPVTVRPSMRTIAGPQGKATLEPKVMQVLVALGDAAGTIQSRDDLIERCWDGRIVGDTSINRVISLLRAGLKEVADDAVTVENVPKVGYHMRVIEHFSGDAVNQDMADAAGRLVFSRPGTKVWLGALLIVALVIAALWAWQPFSSQGTQRLRMVVLPLEMTEEVDPLYGRGFETELRSALAQINDIEVFSSESARILAQEGLSAIEIGERLDADLVWQGSLTSLVDSVSVKASLIDAQSGRALDTFEVNSDLDAAQFAPMRLARSTARSINRPLANDIAEAELPDGRYSLFLTALGIVVSRDKDKLLVAEDILRDYLTDHPDFAFGQMVLGKAIMLSLGSRGDQRNIERFREAGELLARAYELDPDHPQIMAARGFWSPKEAKDRIELLEASVERDPGNVESLVFFGEVLRMDGRTADAVEVYGRIIRIDPLWAEARIAIDETLDLGMKNEARGFVEQIERASTKPWQSLLIEADMARINGDFSEAIRLSERALISVPSDIRPDARRRVAAMRYHIGALDPTVRRSGLRPELWEARVGSIDEIDALGFVSRVFFQAPDMIELATPLLVAQGRGDDLIRIFDARDMSIEDFNWGLAEINGELRDVAPYIVIALRNAGRMQEAQQILDAALESDAKFAANAPDGTGELYDRARLLAVAGNTEGALDALDAALALGLPVTINPLKEPMLIGPMGEDPAFVPLADNDRFKRIAQAVDRQRDKERAEILALGY